MASIPCGCLAVLLALATGCPSGGGGTLPIHRDGGTRGGGEASVPDAAGPDATISDAAISDTSLADRVRQHLAAGRRPHRRPRRQHHPLVTIITGRCS